MTKNDWIGREIAREDKINARRAISKWVKCIVCDISRIARKTAQTEGPLCPKCRKRVMEDGCVQMSADRGFFITYKEDARATPQ